MKVSRSVLPVLVAFMTSLTLYVERSYAQGFPSKPVKVIVAAGAGSTADIIARTLGDRFSQLVGQPWLVENRPGASGLIGSEFVAKANPDGHTLILTSTSFITAPSLYKKVSFDVFKDFAPIGLVVSTPNVVVINADTGVRNLTEFIAFAKRSTRGVDYGSPASGSTAHLTLELFRRSAGIEMVHFPFKGPQQAMVETVSGRVPVTIAGITTALPHIRSGKLVPLVVVDSRRSAFLPDIPTFAEAGFPSVGLSVWFAMLATGGTPAAAVDRLNHALNETLRSPEVLERLKAQAFDTLGGTSQQLADVMRREFPVYAKLISELKLTVD